MISNLLMTLTDTNLLDDSAAKEAALDVTAGVVDEISGFQAYINEHLPDLLAFGIKVVLAVICFLIGQRIIKLVRKLARKSLERSSADKGVEQFIDSLLKFALYAILIVSIVTKFGVEPSSIAALIASGGVAIGLALQGSLSNFAGGVLILLLKPFVVGDYIIEDAHGNEGTVKEIQIFYTKLATVDNKIIVIPNQTLTSTSLTIVTAEDKRRLDFLIQISYQSDLRKAKSILEQILRSDLDIMQEDEILVFVDALEEHAVRIGTRAWVAMDHYWPTRWRLLEEIKTSFDREGIVIPYPRMMVHMAGKEE